MILRLERRKKRQKWRDKMNVGEKEKREGQRRGHGIRNEEETNRRSSQLK